MSLMGSSAFRGEHATFSPSSVSWINYSDEQFLEALKNKYRSQIGTEIHEWAAIQITLGQRCTSVRDAVKSIKTMIFEKYFSEKYGLSDFGKTILTHMRYIPNDVYGTVKEYVNDSIAFFMVPEECEGVTDYSKDFYGTCDALYFDSKKKELRIFDLKTGSRPAKIEQVYIYAALYCLRNKVDPFDICFDLRIYQNGTITVAEVSDEINAIVRDYMDRIIRFDKLTRKHYKEGGAL